MRNPLLTRSIVRRLMGSSNAALRYLHNQDAPPEQTMYRVLGRVGTDIYRDDDAEDGSPTFTVPVWLGRLGIWAFKSEHVWVYTMDVQWVASLRKGYLIDVAARVYKANSKYVHLWREGADA